MNDQMMHYEESQALDIWKKKELIKKNYAPDLTNDEFPMFIGMAKSLNANPWVREIFAQVYSKNDPNKRKVVIFCGRDFYRRKAQEQGDYNGHTAQSVYANDKFSFTLKDEIPTHVFDVTIDRGELMGAYGMAWRKGVDRPFFVYVKLSEVDKRESTWSTQKVTQLEKVAEARVLRMAWQGVFKGTYAEEEKPIIDNSVEIQEAKRKMKELNEGFKGREVESKKIDGQPNNDAGDKLKRRMEKIYQTDGEIDYDVIAEELIRLSTDKKGQGSVNDFADLSAQKAKATLLKLERERFQRQLDTVVPDENDQADYLRALTSYEDSPGFGSVEDFKDVDHIYIIKDKHKKTEDIDKVIYDYREKFEEQYGGEG
jgi:phage recombination protein Bet